MERGWFVFFSGEHSMNACEEGLGRLMDIPQMYRGGAGVGGCIMPPDKIEGLGPALGTRSVLSWAPAALGRQGGLLWMQ